MSLFKLKKNKSCTCGGNCNEESMKESKSSRIKILGSGCAKCNELEKNVVEALRQLGNSTEVEHIKDFSIIASYGVMTTPAIVVDDKVVSYGKVLNVDEALKILKDIM